MLDTLMVLWTKGIYSRFLRLLCFSILLCSGVALVLFFIIISGVQWPGRAATSTPATPRAKPTGVAVFSSLPTILQNPRVLTGTPTDSPQAPRQTAIASTAIAQSAMPSADSTSHSKPALPHIPGQAAPPRQPASTTNPNPASLPTPDIFDPFSTLRNYMPAWGYSAAGNKTTSYTEKQ